MNPRSLLQTFEDWQSQSLPLVLATVIETQGSTYTKAGARMLLNPQGSFQGLLSGGCLEGDLLEHAQNVSDSGTAQTVTYDMRGDADLVWGMGIGCDGLIRVFLQPLVAADGYQPFATICAHLKDNRAGVVATLIDSDEPGGPEPGVSLIVGRDQSDNLGVPDSWAGVIETQARHGLDRGENELRSHRFDPGQGSFLYAAIEQQPCIVVLGAGPDAVPVVELAVRLGWRVTVADHRPAYLANTELATANSLIEVDSDAVDDALALSEFDAAIVMSHHLETDRRYLAALAESPMAYIGLLGPAARKARLLDALGEHRDKLESRLFGPAGLDIGGSGPEAIALSIIAQIHAVLYQRDGAAIA